MGCIDSKPAVPKPAVPLRGVSEQHIDLHLASKQQNKRNNVFTAGAADVSHVDLKAKNFPKTREQEKIIRACIESPEAFFFQGISEEEKQLLFNAMQATTVQAGHPIIVQGDQGDNFYIVESGTFYATLGGKRIKDYGRGIAKENLPHIFDRFYTKSRSGTGIGLAFCKTLMEELGGTIECKSSLGKYTRFTLTFPELPGIFK